MSANLAQQIVHEAVSVCQVGSSPVLLNDWHATLNGTLPGQGGLLLELG